MAIVSHYSRYAVRWRLQAERGKQTRRLYYQAFIDFGCEIKLRTALSYMPVGTHLEPVQNADDDIQRAADYCVKDDTRCSDDDEDLDMMAGPYSYGFDDDFDVSKEMRMIDVQDDICDAIAMADDAGVDMTALHDALMASIKAMTDAASRARVRAYTREREDSNIVSKIGNSSSQDRDAAISSDASSDEYDALFDDDVDTAAAGDVASASDAAAANMLASSDSSDAAELARIDAADVSSMTPAEQAAFFAPLFADDADDDASMFAGDDTAASADAFDVDSLDAEIADSFADDAAGACVHIASKAADDAAPVHTAAPAAAVVNTAGNMNDDFAAMCEVFARPQIDENVAYFETVLLSRKL